MSGLTQEEIRELPRDERRKTYRTVGQQTALVRARMLRKGQSGPGQVSGPSEKARERAARRAPGG